MRPAAKLGAYGLVLASALGGGAAVGAVAGPINVGSGDEHSNHGDPPSSGTLPAGGLLVAQDGYRFVPEDRRADAGEFAFSIVGPDGSAVTDFVSQHDRNLHLIVASRQLTVFHHVHPEMDARGRWSVVLPELSPGAYRAFADFRATGAPAMTLGVDLTGPGLVATPTPLKASDHDAVDGYDVTLAGAVTANAETEVTVTVRRGGSVVTTDPYLGAGGHLVALRDGDLAYLHVHPLDDEPAGPVRFAVEVPSVGTYALFFDFLHQGRVHTARFVVEAAAGSHSDKPAAPAHGASHN